MKFYEFWRSSAAFRVRIALNLKGLAYESRFVKMMEDEHRGAEYAALNPQRLVPTLIDGEVVLNQSLAIIEYLDERYPEPPLVPGDAVLRARIRAFALAIACEAHPLHNRRVLAHLGDALGAGDAEQTAWAGHWTGLTLGALEERLAAAAESGPFCFGEAPTLADVCLVPQVAAAQRFAVDLAAFPMIGRIAEVCLAMPAFAEALPARQADAPQD